MAQAIPFLEWVNSFFLNRKVRSGQAPHGLVDFLFVDFFIAGDG